MLKKKSFDKKTALVLLLSFFLRVLGINSRPIWYDEAFSVLFSAKGIREMLAGTLTPTGTGTADIHPLGYYSLLWSWMQAFGETLLSVRLLSVLLGVGIVFLVYKISSYLFNEKIGFYATFFVALAPFQIHYAQEIRMYALLALWLLLALYAYLKGIKDDDLRWILVYSVITAFSFYTHNLAAFFLLPLAATSLFFKKRKVLLKTIFANIFALLLYLPWLIHLPAQFTKVEGSYWTEKPGIERLFTLLLSYVTNLPIPDSWLLLALFLTIFPISIALLQTFRALKERKTDAWRGAWLLYLSFTPAITLFLVSQKVPVFIERALLPSGAIFCLWLAWALFGTKLPRFLSIISGALLLIGAFMGLYQHLFYVEFPYAPYRQMSVAFSQYRDEGDLILHSNKLTALPLLYFAPNLPQKYIADAPGSGTDTLAFATQKSLDFFADKDLEGATKNADSVYFIIFKQSIMEYEEAGLDTHPHLQWLDKNYFLEKTEYRDDVIVYFYTR
ncbi:MAG: hypothetical protein GY755_03635 [Chloroflexi bacterium]|nr:hypothetical protein [Chloroflexota bacterium]